MFIVLSILARFLDLIGVETVGEKVFYNDNLSNILSNLFTILKHAIYGSSDEAVKEAVSSSYEINDALSNVENNAAESVPEQPKQEKTQEEKDKEAEEAEKAWRAKCAAVVLICTNLFIYFYILRM